MNQSISRKLFVTVVIAVLLLFLLLLNILILLAREASREQLIDSAIAKCRSGNQFVENERSYLRGVSDYYSSAPEIQQMLRRSNQGLPSTLPDEVFSLARQNNYVLSLTFYDLSGSPVDFMTIDASHTPTGQGGDDARPFQRLVGQTKAYEWEFIPQNDTSYMTRDNSPKLCLWRPVKNAANANIMGVMAVSVDSRKLLGSRTDSNTLIRELMILDRRSGQVASNYTGYSFSDQDRLELVEMTRQGESGHFQRTVDGETYLFFYANLDGTLSTFYVAPQDFFDQYLNVFYVYTFTALVLFVVLLIPLFLLVHSMVAKPLRKLTASMRSFSRGDYDVQLDFRYQDEIGQLGAVFNDMVRLNRQLLEQTYELGLRGREAEFAQLQAQIDPHFLNNLINTIQWSALRHGDSDTADIAYSMSQVLRLSLNRGEPVSTVRRERDLITYYLKLQTRRFGDRIRYHLNIDSATLDISLPKLLIQPLVENAILHGTRGLDRTVTIRVSCGIQGSQLVIRVEDDGAGMPRDTLDHLLDRLPDAPERGGSRYALKNIHERLRLIYGHDFAFQVDSAPGEGTSIRIHLPVQPPARLLQLMKHPQEPPTEGAPC